MQRGLALTPHEKKLFHFHGEFSEKSGRINEKSSEVNKSNPLFANLNPLSRNPGFTPGFGDLALEVLYGGHFIACF